MHASLASRIAVVLCCLAALNLLPGARGQDKEVEKLAEQLKKLNPDLKLDKSNPAQPWYTIEAKLGEFSRATRDLKAAEFAKLVPILQETTVPIGLVLRDPVFTDADLAALEKLGCVRSLTLDFDALTDKGLRHVAGIKDLSDLTIVCGTLMIGIIDAIPRNDITKAGMDSLQSLKRLESLSLSGSCAHLLKGDALAVLTVLPKLRKLSIDSGGDPLVMFPAKKKTTGVGVIDQEASRIIGSIANLQSLALAGNIGTDVLEAIKNMHSLVELDLSHSTTTDAGMTQLRNLKSLRTLDLRSTSVTNVGLASLSGLKDLETLALGTSTKPLLAPKTAKITDEGLAHLAGLAKLRVLDMGNCAIQGPGLKHLVALPRLEKLNLAYAPLTEEGLAHLRPLTQLRELNLIGTHFDEDTVWALKQALPRTQIVDPLGDEVPLVKKPPRKLEDLSKTPADFKLTAAEYFKEFDSDKNARDKYRNKVVELSGKVARCGFDNGPYIVHESMYFRCMTAQDQPWARHAPGQKVKIRGRQADRPWPLLLDSIVVEAEPNTAIALTVEELSRELAADKKATHKKYAGKTLLLTGILAEREPGPIIRLSLKTEGTIRIRATLFRTESALIRPFKVGGTITLYGQLSKFSPTNVASIQSCLPIKKDPK